MRNMQSAYFLVTFYSSLHVAICKSSYCDINLILVSLLSPAQRKERREALGTRLPNKISSFTSLDSFRFLDNTVPLVYWIGYLLLQSYLVPVSLGVGRAGVGKVFGLVQLPFDF